MLVLNKTGIGHCSIFSPVTATKSICIQGRNQTDHTQQLLSTAPSYFASLGKWRRLVTSTASCVSRAISKNRWETGTGLERQRGDGLTIQDPGSEEHSGPSMRLKRGKNQSSTGLSWYLTSMKTSVTLTLPWSKTNFSLRYEATRDVNFWLCRLRASQSRSTGTQGSRF